MTIRKKILLGLLVIPLILGMSLAIWQISPSDPHNGIELLFLIFGLPILILNYLEWYAPTILDDIFGTTIHTIHPPKNANTIGANQVAGAIAAKPGWQMVAVMATLLFVGIALGAGGLTLLAKNNPAIPSTATQIVSTSAPKKTRTPVATNTATVEPTNPPDIFETMIPTEPGLPLLDPTPSLTSAAPNNTPGTPPSTNCTAPSQVQFDIVQSDVQAFNLGFDIKTGYLVKSPDIDGLWFFGAKIYGTDFQDGGSDPGVWAFMGPLDSPTDIFALNDVALQYSDFELGQKATSPVDMESNGALAVYDCTASSN